MISGKPGRTFARPQPRYGPDAAGAPHGQDRPRTLHRGGRSTASFVTDALAPAHILIVLLLVVGWHSDHAAGIGWAFAVAAVSVGIPTAVVLRGVRTGRFTDVHVRVRQQRAIPLALAISCAILSTVALVLLGAPRELTALVGAILAGLATGALVTIWWKVSGHTAVAGSATVILTALFGVPLLSLLAVSVLIGWSRVVLRDHTLAQTVVGFLMGAGVSLAVFVPLHS